MDKTIFQKIIEKEIPSDIIFEDELCIVIKDIAPQAPIHMLVIPKKSLPRLFDACDVDQNLLGHLLLIANKMAKQMGVEDAFRIVINNGAEAGQTVFHLHLHILAHGGIKGSFSESDLLN